MERQPRRRCKRGRLGNSIATTQQLTGIVYCVLLNSDKIKVTISKGRLVLFEHVLYFEGEGFAEFLHGFSTPRYKQ